MLSILNGILVTDRMAYRDAVPRSVSVLLTSKGQTYRTRTNPWLVEFEAILTSSLDGLPFGLRMPKSLVANANVDDVSYHKSHVEAKMLYIYPIFKFPGNDHIISLLFCNDIKKLGKNVNYLFEESFPTAVDGNAHPVPGSFLDPDLPDLD
ncbi:hypothetical protein BDZ94DRAFT_626302 [Collybia nuda]|uniref:Uncharacterized protein n=1 Tax=Collybia nuda TaxID=64659 RepID=A0A9P6CIK7_9AGAR|nr:hypothetical protein BDZ94DRAFT_626302 [Collybia nuda]